MTSRVSSLTGREKELYNLKLNGETLKNMKDVSMSSQASAFKHEQKNVKLPSNASKSRFFPGFQGI